MKLKLPKELTTVTKTSKILAAILFITLPFLGFFAGINYQQTINSASQTSVNEPILVKRTTTPTPSQTLNTSTWKTYTNARYGYAVKYPTDWLMTEREVPGTPQTHDFSLTKQDKSQEKVDLPGDTKINAQYSIRIRVSQNPDNYSAKDYLLRNVSSDSQAKFEKGFQNITVDEVTGIKLLQGAAPASGLATTIYISHNNIYEFSYGAMAHEETHEKFSNTFNQILSTFKFLP